MNKTCDHCGEIRLITHRIRSEIIKMDVCYQCGLEAERIRQTPGGDGELTIQLIDLPNIIPLPLRPRLHHH